MNRVLRRTSCVSDCTIPSCLQLNCPAGETCVLSSQTCDTCPVVSCIALGSPPSRPAQMSFQQGQLAEPGIIVAVIIAVLIFCALFSFLIWKLMRRLGNIGDSQEKQYWIKDLETIDPATDTRQSNMTLGSLATTMHAESPNIIRIGLHKMSDRAPSLEFYEQGDMFFSADELLRMSYAASSYKSQSVRTSIASTQSNTAIIKPAQKYFPVRAKGALIQVSKAQDPTILQRSRMNECTILNENKSYWDDSYDVPESPIEMDMIDATFEDHFHDGLAASRLPDLPRQRQEHRLSRALTD